MIRRWLRASLVLLPLALALPARAREPGRRLGQGTASLEVVPVDRALARLVPTDAAVLVYTPSVLDLGAKIRQVVAAFDPHAADELDVEDELEHVPGFEAIDRTRPMALALEFPAGGPPVPTLLATVTDLEEFRGAVRAAGLPRPASIGNAVALRWRGDPPPPAGEVPEIAKTVAAGDLAIRVDVAALLERYGDALDRGLDSIGKVLEHVPAREGPFGGSPRALVPFVRDVVSAIRESAERLDVSLRIEARRVHVELLLTAQDGSPLAGMPDLHAPLAPWARALPPEFPVRGVFQADFPDLLRRTASIRQDLLGLYPAEMQALARRQMKLQESSMGLLGPRQAFAFDLGPHGMRFIALGEAKDADAYVANLDAELRSGDSRKLYDRVGMEMRALPSWTIADTPVHRYRMTVDAGKMLRLSGRAMATNPDAIDAVERAMKHLYGEHGLEIRVVPLPGAVLTVAGGDKDLFLRAFARATLRPRSGASPLARDLTLAGRHAQGALVVDLRQVLREGLAFVAAAAGPRSFVHLPAARQGPPVPVVVYGTAAGRFWKKGVVFDAGALGRLVRRLEAPESPHRAGRRRR